jgi:SecD/SecF fusion protein
MSVVLQVDLREFLRALARNTQRTPLSKKHSKKASQAQSSAQDDFISLFADAWAEVRGDKTLAPIFQRNDALRDQVGLNTSDAEVLLILREKADETVSLTYDLLKKRIDQLGVVQPNVSLDADRDLILVELPRHRKPRACAYLPAGRR